MPDPGSASPAANSRTPEDELRAQFYRLLGAFLSRPPDDDFLDKAAVLGGDTSELGQSIRTLAHLCARTKATAAAREYHDLFIGVGRGELLPYASYYLTGFLHEKPLAALRSDMQRLGIEPDPEIREPEDHIASICEMMAGLIDGTFGAAVDDSAQRMFFQRHINSWAPHFFRDLEGAQTSVLYAVIGKVGKQFLEIEAASLDMLPAEPRASGEGGDV